jgi:hypothetical protein
LGAPGGDRDAFRVAGCKLWSSSGRDY